MVPCGREVAIKPCTGDDRGRQRWIDVFHIERTFHNYWMRKDLSVRPAQTAVPLSCSFLLLIGCAIQHLAGQFDLEWFRRAVPPVPGNLSITTVGFFVT